MQASSIIGILSSLCSRYKYTYVLKRYLWINRLHFNISNSANRQSLTIDTRGVSNLGPAKFRTKADSNKDQICYYNQNKSDTSFNFFLTLRKQTSSTSEIIFSIVNLIDKSSRNDNIYFEINHELSYFKNDNIQNKPPIQRVNESNTVREIRPDGTDRQICRNDTRFSKKSRFLSE